MEPIDEKTSRAMNYADKIVGTYGDTAKWELCCDSYLQGANEQDSISRAEQKAIDIESFKKWVIDNSYIPFDYYNDAEGTEEDRVLSFSDLMNYLKAMEE